MGSTNLPLIILRVLFENFGCSLNSYIPLLLLDSICRRFHQGFYARHCGGLGLKKLAKATGDEQEVRIWRIPGSNNIRVVS